jgi:hypothetical protein
VAYGVGYPSISKIRLWKVGSSTYRDIKAPGAKAIALGAGIGGRVWVAWGDPANNVIHAVRSNTAVSRFGAVRTVPYPSAGSNVGYVYKMAVDGLKGPLDVVVNSTVPGQSYNAMYHTQIYAPLLVKLSKSSVKSSTGGSVTVTVTEAGSTVAGAAVSFGGKTVRTNSHGKAVIKIAKHASKGRKTVTVSLTYYVTTRVSVKVT